MAEEHPKFNVTIVTPQGTRREYNVYHLRAPGIEGEFGVLAGHIPFMTALKVGCIHLNTDEGERLWATSGGFAEVLPDHTTILAETAEPAESIDLERAEAARRRALNRIQSETPDVDITRAHSAMSRALNRLHIASIVGRS